MYSAGELDTDIPIILININKQYHRDMTAQELYDATRQAWVIGTRRERAQYAVATYRGLTREVYRIDSWYPITDYGRLRWGFEGKLASDDVRKQLRYKSISTYFTKGAANPIKYVNC
ncbi:hypothetical protein J4N39_16610 [Vibrio sp. SCSIO 43136]|nr:hypothetical protein J4N39_16610 [Vibrio sp. SCSIO 43136]